MSLPLPENSAPKVCLDGNAVKNIREIKKLTQLYVSKVVGVTTDTVSRWENNRYPSIRRENALKLAEALEVDLEEILQGGDGICSIEEPLLQPGRNYFPLVLVLLTLVVLAGLATALNQQGPVPTGVSAERKLPTFAAPGSIIPIQVHISSRKLDEGFILKEYFPEGWKLTQAYPPASSLDNVKGVARWIVKAGETRDRIVYMVRVSKDAKLESKPEFHGELIASAGSAKAIEQVAGATSVQVEPWHWADLSGDGEIDDGEMLEASYTVSDMEGVQIDWTHLESLWDAPGYAWNDKKRRFDPKRQPIPKP